MFYVFRLMSVIDIASLQSQLDSTLEYIEQCTADGCNTLDDQYAVDEALRLTYLIDTLETY